ncbi:helix-turn-helix transcriptional regulator [Methylosarcina fibrata]|uniref:helix-turn-helix transcriptional regulator n=1 Tax=Methylosarcina fibrata TaxID=105972 RepID=UPI00035F40DB|nr:winged helix-turn-helix transcriptional regulator [Methylosarcina fibrata]
MADGISSRQQQILDLLLESKAGLCIDEIAAALGISRNAVQQHLNKLERDGYVTLGSLNKTAGRPVRSFVLTEAGFNSFPKQYAWFSELILASLKEKMGHEAFLEYLHQLGLSLSQSLLPRFEGLTIEKKIEELLKVMDGLGFLTRSREDPAEQQRSIEAFNCVYHDLANKYEEICEFDRTLIATLLNREIDHTECMSKGGAKCCFRVRKKPEQ